MAFSWEDCAPPAPEAVHLEVPVFEGEEVSFDLSGLPDPKTFADVGPPPDLELPDFPGPFTYTEPAKPDHIQIDVPDFPLLTPVEVQVDTPAPFKQDLQIALDWTDTPTDTAGMESIKAELERVRAGDFSITHEIWQQIFGRSAQAIHKEGLARRRQARSQWASRGWMLPGGAAFAAEQQAAQEVFEQTSKLATDTAIEEAKQKDQQFWQSVAEGVKLEAQLADINEKQAERHLRYAIALQEASVSVYNALVSAYNTEVQRANIEVQRVGAEIEAQKAVLQDHRMKLDAAIAKGEIKKAEIEVYTSQWQGIQAAAGAYSASVQAIQAQVEAQKAAVETYGAKVEAKKADVEAYVTEWQGYKTKMDAQRVKVDYYGQLVNRYAARVQAYDVQMRGLETGERSKGALAQAAASCASNVVGWDKNRVDAAIGQLQHDASMARVSIEQQNADTTERDEANTNQRSWREIQDKWLMDNAQLDVAWDKNRIDETLGWGDFQNKKDVTHIKGGYDESTERIRGDYNKQVAHINGFYDTEAASIRAQAQVQSSQIDAEARIESACIDAKARREVAIAETETQANIAHEENVNRTNIAESQNRTQLESTQAQVTAQENTAATQADTQLQAAKASAIAQVEAAALNSYHYSFSDSKSVTSGTNQTINTYWNDTTSCTVSNDASTSDQTNYIENNIENNEE